jgi:predicted Rossmann fold nucleotide-binding protein DprA/Smf involved in DNA uptake
MIDYKALGNTNILSIQKTAFFCSDKFSAGSVLKSYDWATKMKRENRCVISGFQSKLEKDVFEILLAGTQPMILVLARGLYEKPPGKLTPHVVANRLLIVSPFDNRIHRPNREFAMQRNQFIVDVADDVVIAHIHEGGMLSKLSIPLEKLVRL